MERDSAIGLTKKVDTTIPLQVEASSIGWVASLASALGVEKVVFESDSQLCNDCFTDRQVSGSWRIVGLVNEFSSSYDANPFWSFSQVCRGANSAPILWLVGP